MLGYFNRTDSIRENSWRFYKFALAIDAVLVVLSIPYVIFWTWIMVSVKKTHRNVRLINFVFYSQYGIQLGFMATQIILTICGLAEEYTTVYVVCSTVRAIGLSYAFFIIPALILERCYATFFVSRYEKRECASVGNAITTFQILVAFSIGLVFNRISSTIPILLSSIIVNIIAVIYHTNLSATIYSLSERYQIAENILSSKMFATIIFTIGIFNVIMNICYIIDNYEIPMKYKNLAVVVADYCCLIYGYAIPILTYFKKDSWRKKVQSLFRKKSQVREAHLKNIFGVDMMMNDNKDKETLTYFNMLKNQWNKS
ncbi:unnamed protein product [Caenorhabditis bovis]|uniref:Uncharacterized protein n=1 Tax=Caenorhabditis bovis TaxID=2654633 RepID=A0A8S1EEC6_9PELO|nr:unnamed protein product [Caenorhabditis bovis]